MKQKFTLNQAMLVIKTRAPKGTIDPQTEYRLGRPSVEHDLWWVVPPPIGIQVQLFNKTNEPNKKAEFCGVKTFTEDESNNWEFGPYAWRFDTEWLQNEYDKVRAEREEIKSLLVPLTNFIGEDIKDYESAIDSLLHLCDSLGVKDNLHFIKFLSTEYPKQ